MAIILGIESTAHTFGIGVVQNGEILANVKDSFSTADGGGGMIPMEVAKHHVAVKDKIYARALEESGINEKNIDAIAFSQGPGLAPCLLEGIKFAKELSLRLKKPLVGVNHCVAHLEVGKITGAKDPVLLYASGANTQVIAYASGKYRIFGETLDIGVGNFIDSFARCAGIGFPGGPKIEQYAKSLGVKYIELPYTVKGMDVAFSGMLTNLKQKLESKKYSVEDLSYSMQETVFAMLVEVSERALAHVGKNELLLGGGVACNSRLQEMCRIMCGEREDYSGKGKTKFFCPEKSLLVDNGAMIAFLGEIMYKKNANTFSYKELGKVDILPKQRTDDINVTWR
jgi:N6-L-threonylcarbamoyladenine synthase